MNIVDIMGVLSTDSVKVQIDRGQQSHHGVNIVDTVGVVHRFRQSSNGLWSKVSYGCEHSQHCGCAVHRICQSVLSLVCHFI